MNDLIFTLIAIALVCTTLIILIRGHRRDISTSERANHAKQIAELRDRIGVLEQIVTDGGLQTAAQIEAMRTTPLQRDDA